MTQTTYAATGPEYCFGRKMKTPLDRPQFAMKNVKSIEGLLRLAEVFVCVTSVVFNLIAKRCYTDFSTMYSQDSSTMGIPVDRCETPYPYAVGVYAFITSTIATMVALTYIAYALSLNRVFMKWPWYSMIVLESTIGAIVMFIIASVMVGFSMDLPYTIAGTSLGYVASLVFACHVIRTLVYGTEDLGPPFKLVPRPPGANDWTPANRKTFQPANPETVDGDGSAPCVLSSVTSKTSSTASLPAPTEEESKEDAKDERADRPVSTSSESSDSSKSECCIDLNITESNLKVDNGSNSELSDKRSWVMTSSMRGSDVTNSVNDNMSTGTYTVDVPNQE